MRNIAALAGIAALITMVPVTPALADGSIIVDDELCAGFVPTVDGELSDVFLTTTDSHQVVRGNRVSLSCHFDIPEGLEPPKGVKADGVPCTKIFSGVPHTTMDSRMSASPGGRAVATCRWDLSVLGTSTKKKKK